MMYSKNYYHTLAGSIENIIEVSAQSHSELLSSRRERRRAYARRAQVGIYDPRRKVNFHQKITTRSTLLFSEPMIYALVSLYCSFHLSYIGNISIIKLLSYFKVPSYDIYVSIHLISPVYFVLNINYLFYI